MHCASVCMHTFVYFSAEVRGEGGQVRRELAAISEDNTFLMRLLQVSADYSVSLSHRLVI